jgi:hypothetical protein
MHVSAGFPIYYFGKPSEELAGLKNAALYSDKIFTPKLSFLRDRFKMKGSSFLDPYSIFSVCYETPQYANCLHALREAGILRIDEEATSDQRAETSGKAIDFDASNKKLSRRIAELVWSTEETRAIRDIFETLSKVDKYKKEFTKKNLAEEIGLFSVCHQFAFNNALMGAAENSAYPITDDKLFIDLFELKTKQLQTLIESEPRSTPFFSTPIDDVKKQKIAAEAFNLCVPYFIKIPIEKIIEIRDDEKSALRRFQQEISKLSALIENERWDEKLEKEIKDVVNDEIRKRVIDLNDSLRNAYYDAVRKIGEAEIILGTAGLSGLMLQGIQSFVAVLGASSIYALKSMWGYFVEREKARENSLYYVMKVSELAQKQG